MNQHRFLRLFSALAVLLSCAGLRAQPAAGAAAQQGAQTARQEAAPEKKKTPWAGRATFNMSLDEGRSYQRTFITSVQVQRPDPKNFLSFEFDHQHSSLSVSDTRVTAADRSQFQTIYGRSLTKRLSLLSRFAFEHDELRGLDHRLIYMQGLGVQLAESKRFRYLIAPGLAVTDQDKGAEHSGADLSGGLMHRFTVVLNDHWTLEHFAVGRMNVNDSKDTVLDAKTSLAGAVSKHFSVQLSLYFNHENYLPTSTSGEVYTRNYANLSAGLGYTWQ